jgi:hypothetical protein
MRSSFGTSSLRRGLPGDLYPEFLTAVWSLAPARRLVALFRRLQRWRYFYVCLFSLRCVKLIAAHVRRESRSIFRTMQGAEHGTVSRHWW